MVVRAWTSAAHECGVIIHIIGQGREGWIMRSGPLLERSDAARTRIEERLVIHSRRPAEVILSGGRVAKEKGKGPF
jgi:hypothetical protein